MEAREFIESRTEGFPAFRDEILRLDIDEMERITGVNRMLVRQAALAYAQAPRAMSFHGLGVTEHTQGSYAVMLIADLAMLTGNIGKPGTGVNPLRGQNNVQGAADMGCQPHLGAGYLDVYSPEFNRQYSDIYNAPVPLGIGLKIPEMFDASLEGKLKARTKKFALDVLRSVKALPRDPYSVVLGRQLLRSATAMVRTTALPAGHDPTRISSRRSVLPKRRRTRHSIGSSSIPLGRMDCEPLIPRE